MFNLNNVTADYYEIIKAISPSKTTIHVITTTGFDDSANEFEKELIVTVEEEKTPDPGHHIPETGVE